MSEYRTGNAWGLTIVRRGTGRALEDCPRREDDELVAVVVNGDGELAERICELLNFEATLVVAARDQCGCLGGLLMEWARWDDL